MICLWFSQTLCTLFMYLETNCIWILKAMLQIASPIQQHKNRGVIWRLVLETNFGIFRMTCNQKKNVTTRLLLQRWFSNVMFLIKYYCFKLFKTTAFPIVYKICISGKVKFVHLCKVALFWCYLSWMYTCTVLCIKNLVCSVGQKNCWKYTFFHFYICVYIVWI